MCFSFCFVDALSALQVLLQHSSRCERGDKQPDRKPLFIWFLLNVPKIIEHSFLL